MSRTGKLHGRDKKALIGLPAMISRNAILKLLLIPLRLKIALSYQYRPLKNMLFWLFSSNEHTNFTYDLHELNKVHLACFVSLVTNVPLEQTRQFIEELETDETLRAQIKKATLENGRAFLSDQEARYGRRLGWYALVRARKPKVVIETGVDKGLGSCVIAAALLKNREEGFQGEMYGIDINPNAGCLLREPYSRAGTLLYGDSIEWLNKLSVHIDLFINDSDHSPEHEMREYQAIQDKLSEDAIIVGDNSHCTDRLYQFALQTGREFLFFREQPKDHWYPGAGIGVAFKQR